MCGSWQTVWLSVECKQDNDDWAPSVWSPCFRMRCLGQLCWLLEKLMHQIFLAALPGNVHTKNCHRWNKRVVWLEPSQFPDRRNYLEGKLLMQIIIYVMVGTLSGEKCQWAAVYVHGSQGWVTYALPYIWLSPWHPSRTNGHANKLAKGNTVMSSWLSIKLGLCSEIRGTNRMEGLYK